MWRYIYESFASCKSSYTLKKKSNMICVMFEPLTLSLNNKPFTTKLLHIPCYHCKQNMYN